MDQLAPHPKMMGAQPGHMWCPVSPGKSVEQSIRRRSWMLISEKLSTCRVGLKVTRFEWFMDERKLPCLC